MKDWSEYDPGPRPSLKEYERQEREKLHRMGGTDYARKEAVRKFERELLERREKARRDYESVKLLKMNEFWKDCRKELGYDQWLDEDGVEALEETAWDRGHSAGFQEVYLELGDLQTLALKLIKSAKLGNLP